MTEIHIVEHGDAVYVCGPSVRRRGRLFVRARNNQPMKEFFIAGLERRPETCDRVAHFAIPEATGHFFMPAVLREESLAQSVLVGIEATGAARTELHLVARCDGHKLISAIRTVDKELTFVLSSLDSRIRPVEVAVNGKGGLIETVSLDQEYLEKTIRLPAGNYALHAHIRPDERVPGRAELLTLDVSINQVGGSEEADLEILPP